MLTDPFSTAAKTDLTVAARAIAVRLGNNSKQSPSRQFVELFNTLCASRPLPCNKHHARIVALYDGHYHHNIWLFFGIFLDRVCRIAGQLSEINSSAGCNLHTIEPFFIAFGLWYFFLTDRWVTQNKKASKKTKYLPAQVRYQYSWGDICISIIAVGRSGIAINKIWKLKWIGGKLHFLLYVRERERKIFERKSSIADRFSYFNCVFVCCIAPIEIDVNGDSIKQMCLFYVTFRLYEVLVLATIKEANTTSLECLRTAYIRTVMPKWLVNNHNSCEIITLYFCMCLPDIS